MSAKAGDERLADQLQFIAAMTSFDRFWEPLAVVIAVAIVWFGTL